MPTNILMPALSPTMTEGTLARWLKKTGDRIVAGDVIAEIETDKATMEVEAVDEGVLSAILVPDGTAGVKVNDPIGVLTEAGETASAPAAKVPAKPAQAAPQAVPNGEAPSDRVVASPLARRMAKIAGLDLGSLAGSGPNGRIVRADVEAAAGRPAPPPASPSPPAAPPAAPAQPAVAAPVAASAPPAPPKPPPSPPVAEPHTRVPLTGVRKVTARRLTEAKQTIPHFYVAIDVTLDALLKLRLDLNAKSPKDGPGAFKLSVNDLLVKAAAVTLRRVPGVNASFTDTALLMYENVDISIAVSIPGGLITPIVRGADRKGLVAISTEARGLIERARAGKLQPDEYLGGSFSISNMGMFGVSAFSAIINPPQGAILAVAAAERRPVVRGDEIGIATRMTCTLSVDHRVIDGALAAEWVSVFKSVVEDPLSLML